MKKLPYLTGMILLIITTSCTAYQYSYRAESITPTENNSMPVVCDLQIDFSKKVQSTSDLIKATNILKSIETAKASAYHRAIVENKCDIIVDPIYRIIMNSDGVTAEITGFGGKYSKARSAITAMAEYSGFTIKDIEKYNSMFLGITPKKEVKPSSFLAKITLLRGHSK